MHVQAGRGGRQEWHRGRGAAVRSPAGLHDAAASAQRRWLEQGTKTQLGVLARKAGNIERALQGGRVGWDGGGAATGKNRICCRAGQQHSTPRRCCGDTAAHGGDADTSDAALPPLPKYQPPLDSSVSCLCRICRKARRRARGEIEQPSRAKARRLPPPCKRALNRTAGQPHSGQPAPQLAWLPHRRRRTLTSERARARRRGSATRCPKSTRRRRARQCAMALRSRALPAMQLSTVSTTAEGWGGAEAACCSLQGTCLQRCAAGRPAARPQHARSPGRPPAPHAAARALTLALAGRGGAAQLLQQPGDQALALGAVHAAVAQHHRHQAAQRVLSGVLRVAERHAGGGGTAVGGWREGVWPSKARWRRPAAGSCGAEEAPVRCPRRLPAHTPAGGACARQSRPPSAARTLHGRAGRSRGAMGRRETLPAAASAPRAMPHACPQPAGLCGLAQPSAAKPTHAHTHRHPRTLHLGGGHGRGVGAGEAVVHEVQDVGGDDRVGRGLQHRLQGEHVLCGRRLWWVEGGGCRR